MAFMEKKSQMTHMEHEIHHYKRRDRVSSSSQMAAILAWPRGPGGLAWRVRELGESPFPEDRDNDRNYWKRGRASERA